MAGPPNDPLSFAIERLEKRSYTTYICRLHAYRRLSRANNAWNASLIVFATSTAIASVGILVDRKMYGEGGDALLLALAILSLVASLVVSSIGYGIRARAMESNYKRIQQIAIAAENLKTLSPPTRDEDYRTLLRDYEVAVDSSENHTLTDYHAASMQMNPPASANWRWIDLGRNFALYATFIVPLLLLIPFGFWFARGL